MRVSQTQKEIHFGETRFPEHFLHQYKKQDNVLVNFR